MISIHVIISILFIHFIADFVMQSHRVSINKSKDLFTLLEHGSIYTLTILLSGFIFGILYDDSTSFLLQIIIWSVINGGTHTFIDFFTSKLNSYLWKHEKVYQFFVSIGWDQFMHIVILFLTYNYICN